MVKHQELPIGFVSAYWYLLLYSRGSSTFLGDCIVKKQDKEHNLGTVHIKGLVSRALKSMFQNFSFALESFFTAQLISFFS